MAQKQTRAEAAEKEETEQPPAAPEDSRVTMSRAEIEAFRAKLQALYHEP
ncbi:hypothetical protein [Nocardia iowensis]|uniref:Uncharacterized protein n=1 Tax=Nocardia iowensis TaxID=204891 RepID=A0ABX8RGZ6_NOCIO|nr:hypothetical protein [Nocardia iowensis]QXN88287.1 hypothetical protein KV110_22035 [Nocardia iowensis]